MKRTKDTRIAIIGGGAAGLTMAYYLKQQGYFAVTVLEREDDIGGLCQTFTHDYCSFDLGANYITPYYKEVMKLGRDLGVKLIEGPPTRVYDVRTGQYHPLLWLLKGEGVLSVVWAVIRYLWILFKYRNIVSCPGFKRIDELPELSLPFFDWLAKHNLQSIRHIFIPPVTIFGYGPLTEVPAAYVLKYMGPIDFLTSLWLGLGFRGWPKRFRFGYERFLQRLSWELRIRTGVTITKITRGGDTIKMESNLGPWEVDELVVACPLDQTLSFMDWSEEEKALFSKVRYSDYCVTAWTRTQVPHWTILEFPYRPPGAPWGISKMYPDCELCLFYTQLTAEMVAGKTPEEVEQMVIERVKQETHSMKDNLHPMEGNLYDAPLRFVRHQTYFPHVDSKTMAEGFYRQLEGLQGKNHTWFTGGLLSFELVETIARYSKQLVKEHFPPV